MNKAVLNAILKLARFNDLFSDLGRMHGGVRRTPGILERLFPGGIFGHTDLKHGPVYLTFDDGPHPEWTQPILDVLDKYGVRGAFFLRGDRLPAAPEVAFEILDRGHSIGYHGLTHKAWWFRSPAEQRVEMNPYHLSLSMKNPFDDSRAKPLWLRPPFGRADYANLHNSQELDAVPVLWRLVVGDWIEGQVADDIAGKLLANVRPGDIVVLHDGGKNGYLLAEALDQVIPLWRMKGMELGDLDDLIREVA